MNMEFKFNDEEMFTARVSAIIYNKDKTKVLFFSIDDGRDFYMLPGGRIEFFESSDQAIKREIFEETGFNIDFNLISIQENFLEKVDKRIMQYAFCYVGIYDGETTETFICKDNDYQTFKWIDISKLNEIKIFPNSTYELINKKDNLIIHSIEKNNKLGGPEL